MFRKKSKSENNTSTTPDVEQQSIEEAVGLFQQQQSENFAELQANKPTVMVVGRSGAGKSSLINAVFGEKVAKVDTGRPVTQSYMLYSNPDNLVNIYDTRGWEGGAEDEKIFYEDTREFFSSKNDLPPDIVWYVVEGPGARFTDYDKQLLSQLFSDRAVIIVISKCDIAHQEQIESLNQAIQKANLKHVVDVVPVSAGPKQGRSSRGRSRGARLAQTNPMGLKELVASTIHNIPDSRQIAFVAAQKADLSEKDQQARKIIMKSSLSAASVSIGGGFSPVPFAEAPFLVGIQMNMLAGIANIYDVGIDLSQIVGAFVTQTLATEVGKMLATEALKVVVGLGTLISAGAKATISGSITITMGFTFRSLYHTIAQYGLEGKMDSINDKWVKTFLENTSKNISKDLKNKSKIEEYDYHERK